MYIFGQVPEQATGSLELELLTGGCETGSLTSTWIHQLDQASKPQESSNLCYPSSGITSVPHHA